MVFYASVERARSAGSFQEYRLQLEGCRQRAQVQLGPAGAVRKGESKQTAKYLFISRVADPHSFHPDPDPAF